MLAASEGMQNVYAPLPFTAHLVFCALATLLYAILFNRRGKKHYLILMIAIDMTFMTQFWTQEIVVFFIGFCEIVMIIFALGLSWQSAKEDRELERKRRVQADRERYEREQQEMKEQAYLRRKYARELYKDNTDIVDNAFNEDDK